MLSPRQLALALCAAALVQACTLPAGPATETVIPTPSAQPTTPAPPTPSPAPTATDPFGDWLIYANEAFGFQFRYPPEGSLSVDEQDFARIDLPLAPGTNLSEKYLEVAASTGADTCQSPYAEGYAPGSLPAETRTINGVEFEIQSAEEGAAGSLYEWAGYSTTREEVCVNLTFILRSANPANFEPTVAAFDQESEAVVFKEIVSTFAWLEP